MLVSRLELLRRERGLTASDLLRSAGYAPTMSTSIEKRKRVAWPALRRKIAMVLGVNEKEIFDDEGFAREAEMIYR